MFSFLKKKPPIAAEQTFKKRVELFWKWYAEVAPEFYAKIEAKQSASLAPAVIAKIDQLLPSFAWVFGPGETTSATLLL